MFLRPKMSLRFGTSLLLPVYAARRKVWVEVSPMDSGRKPRHILLNLRGTEKGPALC